ncbi:hypothetical protein Peur_047591 [Populus x canadensis]
MPASSWRIQVIPTFDFCDYWLTGRMRVCCATRESNNRWLSAPLDSAGFAQLVMLSRHYLVLFKGCHAQPVNSNFMMCTVISLGIVSRLTSRAVHRIMLPCF